MFDKLVVDSFLNNMLIGAASVAPFFATFLYIIFAFYFFFCIIKGNAKLGMRVFFITIHPLKWGFLFGIVLKTKFVSHIDNESD
jgi:hypothetical protein